MPNQDIDRPDPTGLAHLAELADLRTAMEAATAQAADIPAQVAVPTVNPTLQLLEASWTGLADLLEPGAETAEPRPGQELLLVWYDPVRRAAVVRPAGDADLLALKLAEAGLEPRQTAERMTRESGTAVTAAALRATLEQAARQGLVLLPPSRLLRPAEFCTAPLPGLEERLRARVFTLQWHITQACDLHCRHCYDRSARTAVSLEQGLDVLDQLETFCEARNVPGQVSFSGGNPLLHPQFEELYAAAAQRGLTCAILGNPAPRRRIEALLGIQEPAFFQVSLEGLQEHNDHIRGPGHFDRTLEFLDVLRDLDIYAMVMLTLTAANQDQLLPLAETLRGRADLLTFNRLSLFGEGARLADVPMAGYEDFLAGYLRAADDNPVLGLKDGLLNLRMTRQGLPPAELFGGCAGHGCGAAFNFLALLPDGEVHACRKFPSKVGQLGPQGLAEIYDDAPARAFRRGCSQCDACGIKPVCGGCMATAASHGLDPFRQRDPYCFVERA